jgi:sugar/nucleoside kinase (ribokinase family)
VEKTIDCLVGGLATVDIVARPVPLDQPIRQHGLVTAERIELTTGGLVSNSGIALARLGARAAALATVGDDFGGGFVRQKYQAEGLDPAGLVAVAGEATSATIVLVDGPGERSFIFDLGAARHVSLSLFRERRDLVARSKFLLFGYYALVPSWDAELPQIMAEARALGCRTALDAAGDGGELAPLGKILPHLDLYVPSLAEGRRQTGHDEPRAIIETYRRHGAPGIVGLKLGAAGALISPSAGQFVEIRPVPPPGPVVDTTGAGDAFYAGLIIGLVRGLPLTTAGRLAAAAGACCVTGLGASGGLRGFDETWALAQQT